MPIGSGELDHSRLISRLAEAERTIRAASAERLIEEDWWAGHAQLLEEAQEGLRRSESLAGQRADFQNFVLHHSPDLVLYLAPDGTVRWANRPFAPGNGNGAWPAHYLPEFQDSFRKVLATVVTSGAPASHEGKGVGSQGQLTWYSARLGPVRHQGEVVGVVVQVRDVSETRDSDAQLLVSDRMASVGVLAAGMAHEINNPLTVVLANLTVLAEELESLAGDELQREELLRALEDARVSAERIRQIVKDLKVFSRTDYERPEPVDVEQLMDTTVRLARNEIRHRARLVKAYGGAPPVEGIESRLGQVFLNLVLNAAQAIEEGNVARNEVRVSTGLEADGRIRVSVSDTGPGIPPEVQPQLFTPFFTTKPPGVGTGLGLSICHRIVTGLGGELRYRTEQGVGTEFSILLPPAQVTNAIAAEGRVRVVAARRARVWVVDDEPSVGHTLKRMLAAQHEVWVVDETSQVLERVERGEHFDVLLCDLLMPQMTGMELFATLQRIEPSLAQRMVFTTGDTYTPRARTFLDSVSNLHLEKPIDASSLLRVVNQLLQ